MPGDPGLIRVEPDARSLRAVTAALRQEEDGKALRRELGKNLRGALRPFAAHARNAALSIPVHGQQTASPALRPQIAKRIRPEIKLGGKWTGARIRSKKIPNIRTFVNAPKRTQRPAGWKRMVYGKYWVVQMGKAKWFDESLRGIGPPAREAVKEALQEMANRIAERSRI